MLGRIHDENVFAQAVLSIDASGRYPHPYRLLPYSFDKFGSKGKAIADTLYVDPAGEGVSTVEDVISTLDQWREMAKGRGSHFLVTVFCARKGSGIIGEFYAPVEAMEEPGAGDASKLENIVQIEVAEFINAATGFVKEQGTALANAVNSMQKSQETATKFAVELAQHRGIQSGYEIAMEQTTPSQVLDSVKVVAETVLPSIEKLATVVMAGRKRDSADDSDVGAQPKEDGLHRVKWDFDVAERCTLDIMRQVMEDPALLQDETLVRRIKEMYAKLTPIVESLNS